MFSLAVEGSDFVEHLSSVTITFASDALNVFCVDDHPSLLHGTLSMLYLYFIPTCALARLRV